MITVLSLATVLFGVHLASAQTKTRLLTLFPSLSNHDDEICLEVVEIKYGGVFCKSQFQRPTVEYVDGTEPEHPVMRFSEEVKAVDAVVLEPRKAVIASYRITINERAGKCELVYDGIRKGVIPLDIPAPCEIVRNHFGEAQSYRYSNRRTGAFDVILVAGGPVSNARSDELMKGGCGTQIQAISLSPRGVVAGTSATYTLACPTEGFDEKDFAINARPIPVNPE
jgi:hypothetical protein